MKYRACQKIWHEFTLLFHEELKQSDPETDIIYLFLISFKQHCDFPLKAVLFPFLSPLLSYHLCLYLLFKASSLYNTTNRGTSVSWEHIKKPRIKMSCKGSLIQEYTISEHIMSSESLNSSES